MQYFHVTNVPAVYLALSHFPKLPCIFVFELTAFLSLFAYFIISSFFTPHPFAMSAFNMEWIVGTDRIYIYYVSATLVVSLIIIAYFSNLHNSVFVIHIDVNTRGDNSS